MVLLEQEFLPRLSPHLSIDIPMPLQFGKPSQTFPYPFSIYKWLKGRSLNHLELREEEQEQLAVDLGTFLRELQGIRGLNGPKPGQQNWWRGDHLGVYDKEARMQIAHLEGVIDSSKAMRLWEEACSTTWNHPPVWVHGDIAVGNLVIKEGRLSAVIDFGCSALGDPACDLVIAWTYFSGRARELFIKHMDLGADTWLRGRGWALWKATYTLSQMKHHNSQEASLQRGIVSQLLDF
jgi:aminoglycoside phosphotransferase (APT) family kinase protein